MYSVGTYTPYLQVVQHDRFKPTTVHQPPPSSTTGCHLFDPEVHMPHLTWQGRGACCGLPSKPSQRVGAWLTVRDRSNTIYRAQVPKQQAATSYSVAEQKPRRQASGEVICRTTVIRKQYNECQKSYLDHFDIGLCLCQGLPCVHAKSCTESNKATGPSISFHLVIRRTWIQELKMLPWTSNSMVDKSSVEFFVHNNVKTYTQTPQYKFADLRVPT